MRPPRSGGRAPNLNAHSLHDVNNHDRAITDADSGRDVRGEVHVARGVDEINEVVCAGSALLPRHLVVKMERYGT